jgi:hypothetical protein
MLLTNITKIVTEKSTKDLSRTAENLYVTAHIHHFNFISPTGYTFKRCKPLWQNSITPTPFPFLPDNCGVHSNSKQTLIIKEAVMVLNYQRLKHSESDNATMFKKYMVLTY